MPEPQDSHQDAAVALFTDVEQAHRAENVDAYLTYFADDAVWVTGREACYRGRDGLGTYLRGAIPGGLGEGSVTYLVESVRSISPQLAVVIVDRTYTDRDGNPRDERARHTRTPT